MLTAGEVWGVVGVGQKQVVGLGHPEVHHLRCVFQSPHCILMHHILQTDIIHLEGEQRIYSIRTNIFKIKAYWQNSSFHTYPHCRSLIRTWYKYWRNCKDEHAPSFSSGSRQSDSINHSKHHFKVLELSLPSAAVLKSSCSPGGGGVVHKDF